MSITEISNKKLQSSWLWQRGIMVMSGNLNNNPNNFHMNHQKFVPQQHQWIRCVISLSFPAMISRLEFIDATPTWEKLLVTGYTLFSTQYQSTCTFRNKKSCFVALWYIMARVARKFLMDRIITIYFSWKSGIIQHVAYVCDTFELACLCNLW